MGLLILWAFIGYGILKIFNKIKQISGFIKSKQIYCFFFLGFFMSLVLGSISSAYFQTFPLVNIFVDGMYTAGSVWAINSVIEFFEESRIK